MKVIKKGILPSEKKCEWTCRECRSIIESTQGEGEYVSDQRDGDFIKYNCPVCNKENYIGLSAFE